MKSSNKLLKTFSFIFLMSAIISCNPGSKPETKDSSASKKEAVPDTVVQFLITSAAADFHSHQPPTPIDFRNVRIGYTTSKDSEKIFVLCGEFLSQEGKQWSGFTTIKTSGYEQYLGETKYCQDAIMVLTDKNLSVELKNRLTKK